MTDTPLYPLSEFTPEEAAKVVEFEAAPTAPEDAEAALIEAAAAALAEAANAGSVFDPLDLDPEMYEANEEDREYFRGQARAALAVFRGQQDPAVQRVLALHRPYRIYDACSHRHDEEDVRAGRAISVEDVGYTCTEGLMYETCWACCTEESDYQTESCATNHTHGADVPICSTVAAVTAALSVTP